jgi:uncharacterized membrane protein YuzA (DUF378 family)
MGGAILIRLVYKIYGLCGIVLCFKGEKKYI